MAVVYKSFASKNGFKAPGFNVDSQGNLDLGGDISVNGAPVVVNGEISLDDSHIAGLTATGAVSITATPVGAMNNVAIGATTPAAGTFTTLNAGATTATSVNSTSVTTSSVTTGTMAATSVNSTSVTTSSVAATNVSSTSVTASTVTVSQLPSTNNHAANKKYVDTRAIAMSVALG